MWRVINIRFNCYIFIADGLLEKDRKNITVLLKQVSFMKDNTYHLLRHIWNDVSDDWPYYSEQERQSFRRRKPQNLTPPCSDGSTSSSGHSPSSTHPASPPVPTSVGGSGSGSSHKRPYYSSTEEKGNTPSKKKRVSNYLRPPDMKYGSDYGGHSPVISGLKGASSPMVLGRSPLRSPAGSPGANVIAAWSPSAAQQAAYSNKHNANNTTSSSPSTRSPARSENRDFVMKYTKILNKEQRARYKAEFNSNYTNYRNLHAVLDRVSRRFAQLEDKLKQEESGSEAYMVNMCISRI